MTLLTGIGLATMPRDRFAGLQPVPRSDQPTRKNPLENKGQITLKPLELNGVKRHELNAEAAAGQIRLEILNTNGKRARGFSQEDATPLTGDSLRHSPGWHGRSVADLLPGRYLMRLHLDNATAYAMSIQK